MVETPHTKNIKTFNSQWPGISGFYWRDPKEKNNTKRQEEK